MTCAAEKEFIDLLAQLQRNKSLKVWSLIITFFGDVVLPRGGNVSAKTVQQVLNAMGFESGAVRTAFSRLAGDGWIERQRQGRESYYELADTGYQPFYAASSRIYSPVATEAGLNQKDPCDTWSVVINQTGVDRLNVRAVSAIQINANSLLFKGALDNKRYNDCLVISGELQELPAWVTKKLVPVDVAHGYEALMQRFSLVQPVSRLSPLHSVVVRCLLIHEWRRLLLRTPLAPVGFDLASGSENHCREFVSVLYQQLLRRSESWLDDSATCIDGPLPKSTVNLSHRFTTAFNQSHPGTLK